MDQLYKCGYCGFLLNSQCEDLLQHECLKNIYVEGTHDIVEDDQKVLTIVQRNTTTSIGEVVDTEENTSWDERFITYVQKRPPLYNFSLPLSERTNGKKAQLWNEISNLFGQRFSADDLQKKWKYLRDCYMRAKKKVTKYKPSGSETQAPPDPGFKYYKLMQFLEDGVNHQMPICSLEVRSCPSTSTSGDITPLPSPNLLTPTAKKRKTDPNKEIEKGILDALSAKETMDGVDGFLIRLGESLRRLPYRKRALLEIEIMKQVFEAESDLTIDR